MTNDIHVYLIDMPVNELVCPCGAFEYTVYINARLDDASRLRAYKHAIRHIDRNDWELADIQQIETEAHYERS